MNNEYIVIYEGKAKKVFSHDDIDNKNLLVEKLDFLKIDLIVIGPEIPLANGLADFLRKKDKSNSIRNCFKKYCLWLFV